MSFQPQGFLFQPPGSLSLHSCPPFSSGVLLGPRTEDLGRSSSGSAFAPYSGSATSPGFSSRLPYGGEPRAAATLSSFMSPGYDPSSGVSGSLDYHPFGALGPYPYGDPTYRKNATRDATATLKAWLSEHRKNPYPTKGEKIMLAIITKMTLTQVSTWFANARRRLKKENKMTWTPRNRSEDEEEEDAIDLERHEEEEEEEEEKGSEGALRRSSSVGDSSLMFRDDSSSDTDRGFSDPDFRDSGEQRLPHISSSGASPAPPPPGPVLSGLPSKEPVDSNPAPKPKLWSLAEIATSSDRSSSQSPAPPVTTPRTLFPHNPTLPRHLYYTPHFLHGYSGYGPVGPLSGGAGSPLNGLQQTMLQRAVARELKKSPTDL